MSSKAVDITRLTVDDIFRAKEERRRRLARLPFDQKIVIVNKLRAAVKAIKGERAIFTSFLRACPGFAGEPLKEWDVVDEWYASRALDPPGHPFDKRPDIIAITESGRRIGLELKSWINQEQIAAARKAEGIQENIRKAIGEQPPNETQHIGCVWLNPKEVRFDTRDAADFRHQMFALIQEVDDKWSKKPEGDQNYWQDESDFSGSPALEKYLDGARFFPMNQRRLSIRWIRFPDRSTFYSPNDMRETLRSSLIAHKNDERYKDLKKQVGLDEVYLLIHYDFKAFAYNTPFDAPNFGFKQAAEFASGVLNGDGGYFDRVFLFQFLVGKEDAYRIAPSEFDNNPAVVRK
jgi:hypothetical protein